MVRLPDFQTFMVDNPNVNRTWYQFFDDLVNSTPIQGSKDPEGVIQANSSCLYVQTVVLTGNVIASKLWFNTLGSGSLTGWIEK